MVSGRPLSTTVRVIFEPNQYATYSVNSYTAVKGPDGSVTVAILAAAMAKSKLPPIIKGWNYTVRLFRPRLNSRWQVEGSLWPRPKKLKLEFLRHAASAW